MKKRSICLIFIILIIFSGGIKAENIVMNNIGKMEGHTLYDIKFHDGTNPGRSELVFNIDTLIEEVRWMNYSQKRSFDYTIEMKSDYLFKNSGILVDSDWKNNSLIIYSETKTDLDFFNLDVRLKSKSLADNINIKIITGYEWQNYYFVGYGTEQINYTTDPPTIDNISDYTNTITYEIDYSIPYLALSLGSKDMKDKSYGIVLGYSPLVEAKDVDRHLLRNKRSESDTDGKAYFIEADMEFKVRKNRSFIIKAEHVNIETSGTQTQYFADGSIVEGIPVDVNSSQLILSFGYKLRF
ncbi:MAG: omptin family outer membrane protease [Halanaerobiales bacterium]|nr:omptin family outer membrane protease [Halanaerobiales bacterium]